MLTTHEVFSTLQLGDFDIYRGVRKKRLLRALWASTSTVAAAPEPIGLFEFQWRSGRKVQQEAGALVTKWGRIDAIQVGRRVVFQQSNLAIGMIDHPRYAGLFRSPVVFDDCGDAFADLSIPTIARLFGIGTCAVRFRGERSLPFKTHDFTLIHDHFDEVAVPASELAWLPSERIVPPDAIETQMFRVFPQGFRPTTVEPHFFFGLQPKAGRRQVFGSFESLAGFSKSRRLMALLSALWSQIHT